MISQVSVKVKNACGVANWESMSVQDYQEILVVERMKHIQEAAIQFFDESGGTIPTLDAVKELAAA